MNFQQSIQIFWTFFKIGAFTLGSGYAMLPLVQRQIVEDKKWMSDKEFLDTLVIAQTIPGPIALNIALLVGAKHGKFKGAMFASLGVIIPSFVIMLLIAIIFMQYRKFEIVDRIFKGVRPAIIALICSPLISLSKIAKVRINNVWLIICSVLLIAVFHVSSIYVILGGIFIGIIHYFIVMKKKDSTKSQSN